MKGALIIFIAMVAIGIVLYITDLVYYRKKRESESESKAEGEPGSAELREEETMQGEEAKTDNPDSGICCGMHTVCEKTNLSPVTGEIVYYDDEDLDRFKGREADQYTPEEIEEFRDVLLTLLPADVAGWSRSIQVREITLPTEIRDELLMIVSDLRNTDR